VGERWLAEGETEWGFFDGPNANNTPTRRALPADLPSRGR